MGIISKLRNQKVEQTRIQMVTERGNGYYEWDGKLYQSDIVRACIRPKIKACGKLVAKHIRRTEKPDGGTDLAVNPEPYIRFLLEEPNPYMTMQKLMEKLAAQLCLNGNAFAAVIRDENDLPREIYPIPAASAEAIYDNTGRLYLRFLFYNGKQYTFPYTDVIHLRENFCANDIFGTGPAPALVPLMRVISTIDQGIVHAIKNSGVIRWLLRVPVSTRREDLKQQARAFAESFLSTENDWLGVAAVDPSSDAKQVEPKDYVPNAALVDRTTDRIYSLIGVNKKIVQSDYDEDEWNAYYEAEIEPVVIEASGEFSRKLFSRRERGCGNSIAFEAANLATASMTTKLGLQAMVDRGAMLPNEWRAVLGLAPVEGGDKPIRRLDTEPVEETDVKQEKEEGGTENENPDQGRDRPKRRQKRV
jgi:HK97 family phage portal protein